MIPHRPITPVRELTRGVHPRLLYTAAEIDALRARLATDTDAQSQLEGIRAAAERLLQTELLSEEYANAVMTQHGNFYEIGAQLTDFAEKFSLLYSLGETKYVAKMKEALLHYAAFAAWTGPSNKFRKTPWQSDLSTTRIVYAFAVAYDAMYDEFTDEERCVIREAMLKLGIRPLLADWLTDGVRVHALDSMGHNWWSVCTALAGVALCAIYEDVPDWRELMAGMVASLRAFCDYEGEPLLNKVANFDEQGMFYESCGYFNYGAGELCRFLFHYRRCFDDPADDFPVLPKLGHAFMSLTYPTADDVKTMYANFGDSGLRSPADRRDGMMMLPQYLLLLGVGDEALRQYYARGARKPNLLDLLYPALLPRLDATLPPPAQPATEVYSGTGLAFLRSGAAEDGNLLAIRCGFTWNHAHDDAGTFILMRNGEDILCDSGSVSYGKSDYISHYCAAAAHNVVTVNGRGQQSESLYRGNKFPGRLLHLTEGEGISYLLADATGPMCDSCLRNHRSFLRLGEDIFVTVDDLYTYEKAKFSYLLHHRGQSEVQEDGSVIIRSDKNALRVVSVSPSATTVRADSYEGLSHIAIEGIESSRLCQMMHVISPVEAGVSVSPLQTADGYGVRVTVGDKSYDIYYNFLADGRCMHINSNTVLGEFGTDAYILCIEREGGVEKQALMAYGSYLRRGTESVFESLKKEFLVIGL